MTDVVDKKTRSRMMSGIRGKNTKPEILIRKALFKAGFRYRIHNRKLPGNPDIVLPKYHTVIFVNGCFWHGHQCHLFKWPKSRPEFWKSKILGNMERDKRNYRKLKLEGWYILTIWECALKGKTKLPFDTMMESVINWIKYGTRDKIIQGR